MKIDFISNSLGGGGAERVMVLLANYFIIKGHEVTIITFNEGKGDAYQLDSNVERVRLHSGIIKNHTLRSLFNLITYYRLRKNRPEVCISFIKKISFAAIITSKLFSIKIIASEHSNHLAQSYAVSNFTWNYLYRFADHITVLTAFDKPFFENKGAKVTVMPNPSTFIPLVNNVHQREKVILAIGNLDRYLVKGFDNLIRFISPILKSHSDWTLKIVGGGEKGMAFLKSLAREQGVEKQIVFTGFRSNVNLLMQESEIFILSSRYEGLPMALLEAMSQGMACLAYNCITGPSEMIIHEKNGLLVEDQNEEAMQRELTRLMDDGDFRRKIGDNAINSLEKYSIENIYSLWEKLFTKIA